MTKREAYNTISTSTTRESRYLSGLSPDSIGIDQRSKITLIKELRDIAGSIQFSDETATAIQKTWQTYLDKNPIFFLAKILAFDLAAFKPREHTKTPGQFVEQLKVFIATVDEWYVASIRFGIQSITFELENAIQNKLVSIWKIVDKASFHNKLHSIWDKPHFARERTTDHLNFCFDVFVETILFIKKASERHLKEFLGEQQVAKPHIALLVTFLRLYKHLQDGFNGLTEKHLDYYYQNILGQNLNGLQSECTQVFFQLTEDTKNSITLPEATNIFGGLDSDGEEILFKTKEQLKVSKAKIVDLKTLYIASNNYISPHNKLGLVTGIYQNDLKDILDINIKNTSFSIFGEDGFNVIQSNVPSHSEMGWAISTPLFMLKEGVRKIMVDFHLEKEEMLALDNYLDQLAELTGQHKEIWKHRFFSNTFKISLTMPDGWYTVEKYYSGISLMDSSYKLSFSFVLSWDLPPCVPYNAEIHKGVYKTNWPILKIALDETNAYYPYTFLQDVQISYINAKVDVKGIKSLKVYDEFGLQDTSKPFPFLGIQPGKAAGCYIGYDEWRYKNLSTVNFDVKWHQIEHTDFKSIYKSYPEKINYDSFKIDVEALSNKEWNSSLNKEEYASLFKKEDNLIVPHFSLEVDDPDVLNIIPDFTKSETTSLKDAKNGYFKIHLVSPNIGFGHSIYGDLVNKTILEISKDPKAAKKKGVEIPQAPIAPMAESITAHYTAEQELILDPSLGKRIDKRYPFEMYHIHPFGIQITNSQQLNTGKKLLPSFENRGYLHLGFQGVQPLEELSLYFKLESHQFNTIDREIDIRWEYLNGADWSAVASSFLLYDGTDRFQQSGIIKIRMPRHIEHSYPLLDTNTSWLRISIPSAISERFGKVICLLLNGVDAYRVIPTENSNYKTIDTSDIIDSLYSPIPEIKKVTQPFVPFGGNEIEKKEELYQRVSERLFHKNRCVLPSDYEKIILSAFPEVFQVSCFSSTLFPEEVPPGSVQIMVMPYIKYNTPEHERMCNGYRLEKMKRFIKTHASPNLLINITNPFYEILRVKCVVQFKDDVEVGLALQKFISATNEFIAPWLPQKDNAPRPEEKMFNQIIHPNNLKSRLKSLKNVVEITDLSIVQLHYSEEENSHIYNEIKASEFDKKITSFKPWSVFLPSIRHEIKIIGSQQTAEMDLLSIGNMEIENDFILKS